MTTMTQEKIQAMVEDLRALRLQALRADVATSDEEAEGRFNRFYELTERGLVEARYASAMLDPDKACALAEKTISEIDAEIATLSARNCPSVTAARCARIAWQIALEIARAAASGERVQVNLSITPEHSDISPTDVLNGTAWGLGLAWTESLHLHHFGAKCMTQEELDWYAVRRAGVLGTITGCSQWHLRQDDLPERHGYRFRWIATGGVAGAGKLVMTGTTPRTRELLRQGKVRSLQRNYGLSFAEAEALVSAQRGLRFAHEDRVLRFVLDNLHDYAPAWRAFPTSMREVKAWQRRWDVPSTGLSVPRLFTAGTIARRLLESHRPIPTREAA